MRYLLFISLLFAGTIASAQYWDSIEYHRMESDTLIKWVQYGPGNSGYGDILRYHPNIPGWCANSPDMGNTYQSGDNEKT